MTTDHLNKPEHKIQDRKTQKSVFSIFKDNEDISVSLIQRKCRCGYNSASRVFNILVKEGSIILGDKETGVSKFNAK